MDSQLQTKWSTASASSTTSATSGLSQAKKTTLVDKYIMGEELGRGAYGQVYKGIDSSSGEAVAIKAISLSGVSPENLASVMGEIELLKNLNHKNIVKYLGSFKAKSHLYIILEYMENGALSSLIKPNRFGVFPESLGAIYIAQVLQGLDYLHQQGVVHRDIKGANILTTKEGLVKLADFGVAAKLGELEDKADELQQHVVGTPYWMAPEVIEMTQITSSSDIWSVGCLIVELLTGYPPYYDLQPMSALFRIVQDDQPPLPDNISPMLEDFLLKCFQKNPQDRPSAKQLMSHEWVQYNRHTVRNTWARSQGLRAKGKATDAHESVNSVVARILANEEDEESSGSHPGPAPSSGLPPLGASGVAMKAGRGSASSSNRVRDSAMTVAEVRRSPHNLSDAGSHPPSSLSSPIDPGASSKPFPDPSRPGKHKEADDPLSTGVLVTTDTEPSATEQYPLLPLADSPPIHRYGDTGQRTPSRSSTDAVGVSTRGGDSSAPSIRPPNIVPPHSTTPPVADIESPLSRLFARLQGDTGPLVPDSPSQKGGPTLAAWLEDGGAGTFLGRSSRGLTSFGGGYMEHLPDSNGGMYMDSRDSSFMMEHKRKVKELVKSLRPDQKDPTMTPQQACASLKLHFEEIQDSKQWFLREVGILAVMDLLETDTARLAEPAIDLILSLTGSDVHLLEGLCMLGIIPAVCKYTSASWPGGLRLRAAAFVRQLCFTRETTLQMFISCQGLKYLVGMVQDNLVEIPGLTSLALECIWKVLETNEALSLPIQYACRLYAQYGLVQRLYSVIKQILGLWSRQGIRHGHSNSSPVALATFKRESPLEDLTTMTTGHQLLVGTRASTGMVGEKLVALTAGRVSQSYTQGSPRGGMHGEPLFKQNIEPEETRNGPNIGRGSLDNSLVEIMQKSTTMLKVMGCADTQVKQQMCTKDNVQSLLDCLQRMSQPYLLTVMTCLRLLSREPAVLPQLKEAGAISVLVPFLSKDKEVVHGVDVQLEALQSLYNICKYNKKVHLEVAATAGVIPSLCRLVQEALPAGMVAEAQASGSSDRRGVAVRNFILPMLIGMASNSSSTRAKLWACNGPDIFLHLLTSDQGKDTQVQVGILHALDTWLAEDHSRLEQKLTCKDAVQHFVELFARTCRAQDLHTMPQLLDIFKQMLSRSSRLAVALAQGGLMPWLLEPLPSAAPILKAKLLELISTLYEHYPRPKELIMKYKMQDALKRLMDTSGRGDDAAKSTAQKLLNAFYINSLL